MSLFDEFAALRDDLVTNFGVPLATVTTTTRTRSTADRIAGKITSTATATRTVPALIETRSQKEANGEIVKTTVMRCFAPVAVGEKIALGTTSGEITAVTTNDPTGSQPYTWEATLR